jgi:hypothetical protein
MQRLSVESSDVTRGPRKDGAEFDYAGNTPENGKAATLVMLQPFAPAREPTAWMHEFSDRKKANCRTSVLVLDMCCHQTLCARNVPVGPTLIEQASSNPVLLACLSCWEGHIRLLRQPQLFLYQRQQLRRDAIESLRQVEESAQGGTLLPSLQLANIGAVVSSGVSERILGMTCLFS